MSNLIPVGMSHNELAAILRDMAGRVMLGDSYEGHIEYLLPDPDETREGWPDPAVDVWVSGAYRLGNTMGQGGMRIIGTVPG